VGTGLAAVRNGAFERRCGKESAGARFPNGHASWWTPSRTPGPGPGWTLMAAPTTAQTSSFGINLVIPNTPSLPWCSSCPSWIIPQQIAPTSDHTTATASGGVSPSGEKRYRRQAAHPLRGRSPALPKRQSPDRSPERPGLDRRSSSPPTLPSSAAPSASRPDPACPESW